jgi:glycine/D-amino acid oxidase-like deaminating enzyme
MPYLDGRLVERAWTGLRPATASYAPEVCRLEGSTVWLAYGHYRNGILLAPATALRIAEAITASSETD